MLRDRLHADHIDETGVYAKKLEVIQEMLDEGTLHELPEEFTAQEFLQNRTVIETTAHIGLGSEGEYVLDASHADHVDETGRYREQWEKKFGKIQEEVQHNPQPTSQNQSQNQSWKSFLTKIIDEEKSKLNI
jgi:hypothetical protein